MYGANTVQRFSEAWFVAKLGENLGNEQQHGSMRTLDYGVISLEARGLSW